MGNLESSEVRLLLAGARLALPEARRGEFEALIAGDLDWDKVLELAAWHRVSALLQLHLGMPELAPRVPERVHQQLQGLSWDNAARGLYLRAALRKVLETLAAASIPVIVLKGAALAESVYDDPALRPMGDLDLLVPEEDLPPADELLRGLGYAPYVSPEIQQALREHHHHYPALRSPDGAVKLELHRHLVKRESSLYFDPTVLWQRAVSYTIAGTEALVLAPEDLLLHLCLNFFQDRQDHSNGALSQVVDIAEALRFYADRFDWDRFVSEVQRHRLAGPVYCALRTAGDLLDAPWPERVSEELKPADFDAATAELFIRRRVLDSEPWLAHRLVDARSQYTWLNLLKGAFRRVVAGDFSPADLAEEYDRPDSNGPACWLYLRHAVGKVRLFGRTLLRPRELRHDLRLDRWLHSLQRNQQ